MIMAFRADEKAEEGRACAFEYFMGRSIIGAERERSEAGLHRLIDQLGPVVDSYPYWHPLVTAGGNRPEDRLYPATKPNQDTGYKGLDHTIFLRSGFITCPYSGEDRVLESIDALKPVSEVTISAELLDFSLYMPNAKPVLVTCEWNDVLEYDGTIPRRLAVPLLLEQELPLWRRANKCAETWETMRPYILGAPRGSRSSLFVNQETGQTLKTVYNTLIQTGMFGPIQVG